MSIHYRTADFQVAGDPEATNEQFEAFLDRLMSELCEHDHGIVDPDLTASITDRIVSVAMGVEADTADDAVLLYLANVRTGFHGAECGTPHWPTFRPSAGRPTVRRLETA